MSGHPDHEGARPPGPRRRRWLWLPALAAIVAVAVVDTGDGPRSALESRATPRRSIPRPYGDAAPWNIPVAAVIGRLGDDAFHPEGHELVQTLWDDSLAERGLNLGFYDYTYPIYLTDQATGLYPVHARGNIEVIPWNPQWRAAPGGDAQVIVLDPATGREWNLWQVSFRDGVVRATRANLVMVSVETGTTDGLPVFEPTDEVADYRTYEGGFPPSRGVGIQYLAMLVRPEEIRAGVIPHALSMPIPDPSGETFVAPATKLEFPDGDRGIPEGTRFFLHASDTEIEDWIAGLPPELPPETLRAARIVAVALRDYGFVVTDTAGAAFLQFEALVAAGEEWERLGLGDREVGAARYPRDLLDGLVTPERLRVLVPSDAYGA